jgi:hypothetical protein
VHRYFVLLDSSIHIIKFFVLDADVLVESFDLLHHDLDLVFVLDYPAFIVMTQLPYRQLVSSFQLLALVTNG